jgi:hypothetical protein
MTLMWTALDATGWPNVVLAAGPQIDPHQDTHLYEMVAKINGTVQSVTRSSDTTTSHGS